MLAISISKAGMIRLLTTEDQTSIYEFCGRRPALNLYFLGNLETLGVASDICQFWGSFDASGHLNGVLMRYMDGWNIADDSGCDYAGFGSIIDAHPAGATRLQDNTIHTASLLPFIQRYRASHIESETLCRLNRQAFTPNVRAWPVRRANLADYKALCRFYARAEEMARSPRGVERPLKDGRVYLIEVENQIVCSVLTNAETRTMAMIGGVYTLPAHRGRGYAGAAMAALCRSLIADDLTPVLYYQNPAAGAIYHRLGFREIGEWRAAWLEPVETRT